MQSATEIRDRLHEALVAVSRSDDVRLEDAAAWLEGATARDLLRIDGVARQQRPDGPTLGVSEQWSQAVLEHSVTAAALASMHPDGFVRERAVDTLATSGTRLSDRTLALRARDHVQAVRDSARQVLLRRADLTHAGSIMPVLALFESRDRGAVVRTEYVEALVSVHGESDLCRELRTSDDRDLRRTAFHRSIDGHLLTAAEAVRLLPRERDQVVRRLLGRVIADHADPSTIRTVLLRARAAESRALGLVRLSASQLDPTEVEPLLVDSSVLVRLWARQRWEELGEDVLTAYREAARPGGRAGLRAKAVVGLTEAGGTVDRSEVLDLVHSAEPVLHKVGLQLMIGTAQPEDVSTLLDLVRSEQPRVARLAMDVLAHDPGLWSVGRIAELRADASPIVRRRAWSLHRGRGGWESVIADLELLQDPDDELAVLGKHPAPPHFVSPSDAQRRLIADALLDAPIAHRRKLDIALAAGLDELRARLRSSEDPSDALDDAAATEPAPRSWWRRLVGRDSSTG